MCENGFYINVATSHMGIKIKVLNCKSSGAGLLLFVLRTVTDLHFIGKYCSFSLIVTSHIFNQHYTEDCAGFRHSKHFNVFASNLISTYMKSIVTSLCASVLVLVAKC